MIIFLAESTEPTDRYIMKSVMHGWLPSHLLSNATAPWQVLISHPVQLMVGSSAGVSSWLPQTRPGVLEAGLLVSRRLKTRFYKSWSGPWNLKVLVLVLKPSSLGLGTMETRSSSLIKRKIETK